MSEPTAYEISCAIVEAMRSLITLGLSQGTAGNVSVRHGDGFLMTPSGIPADALRPEDIVPMSMEGEHGHALAPSSEWRFHRDILRRRPEIDAVVHAHPTYCTAFAMCGTEIPAVHYMIAAAGGPTIRCAPYAPYGTEDLSVAAVAALDDRLGCLLANHGMIAIGSNLGKALWLAVEMEALCRQYAVALQVGKPVILSDAEIARTIRRFENYGPRSRTETP
ncbi:MULTISPECIES: class II aldolase/adducin family protein [Methylobacterium]|jgi:L-fuculose-phosphate aldolase|uniref:5-(Methylthio)ribulose-1-phosphate aldolase n=1 Tax=Methylobacterium bullatum TaxID=570505 RepID=A0A679JXB1_9HYPH|nr:MULTISPECIES: class II aldolase/adducin family protein [Methylobacterium]KQO52388.1 fuculose phosphate aldolase [Methylobacterium sp. Leaf85]MBD8901779.1 class II aldolase [Methylobacterium bullatum]TXN27486.1 class II aldolase [Methylobacterium sp. WL19]CAA2137464.1 L-fuculose phosphate aldolase [Methylobacterium bullatum]GJD41936.1 5-(methylthio)ribulose-1-phosphate aldolase [Methylobacterium bullatum]